MKQSDAKQHLNNLLIAVQKLRSTFDGEFTTPKAQKYLNEYAAQTIGAIAKCADDARPLATQEFINILWLITYIDDEVIEITGRCGIIELQLTALELPEYPNVYDPAIYRMMEWEAETA